MLKFCYAEVTPYIQKQNELAQEILVRVAFGSYKGSGESAQIRRLARAFSALINNVWMKMKTLLDTTACACAFIRGLVAYAISSNISSAG